MELLHRLTLIRKDTEILDGNFDTLYEGGGKLGPRQHLFHPTQPKPEAPNISHYSQSIKTIFHMENDANLLLEF